jgi:uncharacterized protein (DUF302 family)
MRLVIFLFFLLFLSLSSIAETLKIDIKTITIKGDYADIKETLEMAITDRGMVISKVFFIADMLQRTGKVVGATNLVYVNGEILSFCSARLSRKMMQANPEYISICPFKISVYSLPNNPANIYLTYQAIVSSDPQTQKNVFYSINQLLATIVSEVVDS